MATTSSWMMVDTPEGMEVNYDLANGLNGVA
jgi:hypothetical protein